MAVFAGFSPGFEAFFVRFHVSCFPDGGGVLQSGRDYYSNHDQIDISLKCRFPVLEALTDQITHL